MCLRVNENGYQHYALSADINNADIVARIDLTSGKTNPESTATDLPARAHGPASRPTSSWTSWHRRLDTKAQNRELLRSVNDYYADAQLDRMNQSVRQRIVQLLQQLQAGRDRTAGAAPQELSPVGERLHAVLSEQGRELEDGTGGSRHAAS